MKIILLIELKLNVNKISRTLIYTDFYKYVSFRAIPSGLKILNVVLLIQEKLLKRADVVWRNGIKNVNEVSLLFNCLDLVLKYEVEGDMRNSIKKEIWARKDQKQVWTYIAEKELEVSIQQKTVK